MIKFESTGFTPGYFQTAMTMTGRNSREGRDELHDHGYARLPFTKTLFQRLLSLAHKTGSHTPQQTI